MKLNSSMPARTRISLIILMMTTAALSAAELPPIAFQGRLKQNDGLHIDDPDGSFSTRLYDAQSGGTELWSTTTQASVNNGLFSLALSIPPELLAGDPRWLGVSYNGQAEMPRVRLLAVPYAARAGTAIEADGDLRLELDQIGSQVGQLAAGAANGANITTYGAQGDGASHPLSATEANAYNNAYDIGAAEGDERDWAAIQAALSEDGRVYVPSGTYLINRTIDIGHDKLLSGAGGRSTCIRTTGHCIAVRLGTFAQLLDCYIDGDWKGKWGIHVTNGHRGQLYRCIVRHFVKGAGLVMDGTQNSLVLDCNFSHNFHNIRLMNGVRNVTLINVNGSSGAIPNDYPNRADCRNIYIGYDDTDPDYAPGATSDHGNSQIGFYGCIFEHNEIADYDIELADYAADTILIQDSEVHGGKKACVYIPEHTGPPPVQGRNFEFILDSCLVLKMSPDDAGGPVYVARSFYPVTIRKCRIAKRGTARLVDQIPGNPDFRVEASHRHRNQIYGNSSDFQGGIGRWQNDGNGVVSWNADIRALTITSSTAGHGGRVMPLALPRTTGTVWMIRLVIGAIDNNADGSAMLRVKLEAAPWGRDVVSGLGPGVHEIPYVCQGDEVGIAIAPAQNSATTITVHEAQLNVHGNL